MKTILFFLLSISTFSQWHKIEGYRPDDGSWIMHFFDDDHVLYINTHGGFSVSSDAGLTWDHTYYPDDGPYFNDYVDFHGDVMYSLGGDFGESGNTIYKIWNYGLDFEILGTVSHEDTKWWTSIICMYDDEIGVTAVPWQNPQVPESQGFRTYFTTDAGETWQKRRTLYYTYIDRYIFVDEMNFYVIHDGKVSYTDDQAVSWQGLSIKANNKDAFHAIDDQISYSAFNNYLMKTEDRWSTNDTLLALENEDEDIVDFDILDDGIIWALSSNGDIYSSIDDGKNWNSDSPDLSGHEIRGMSIQGLDANRSIIKLRMDEDSTNFFRNYIPVSVNEYNVINNRISRIGNAIVFDSEWMGKAIIEYYDLSGKKLNSYNSNLIVGQNFLQENNSKIFFVIISFNGKKYSQVIY